MDADVLQLADDGGDSDDGVGLPGEAVPGLIACPHCAASLPPTGGEWIVCGDCHRRISVPAQQAYARARRIYQTAQDLLVDMQSAPMPGTVHRARTRFIISPLPPEIVRGYQQAYSGLTVAFRHELADVQKVSGIEMMAEIARVFAPRAMMSPLEAEYWTKLSMEVTARRELADIEERLSRRSTAISPGFMLRWQWWQRRRELRRTLKRLRAKIAEIEREIRFVDPPDVYVKEF